VEHPRHTVTGDFPEASARVTDLLEDLGYDNRGNVEPVEPGPKHRLDGVLTVGCDGLR
jgi:hypothetical protein